LNRYVSRQNKQQNGIIAPFEDEGENDKMEAVVLNPEIGITLGVMGVAIILFITNAVRVDVVGIIMIVALPLLKIIEPKRDYPVPGENGKRLSR